MRARAYNLTLEQVIALEAQESCPGCLRKFDGATVRQNFDHCHTSGVFRRVLCWGCNVVLGKVQDNPDTLTRLAAMCAVKA